MFWIILDGRGILGQFGRSTFGWAWNLGILGRCFFLIWALEHYGTSWIPPQNTDSHPCTRLRSQCWALAAVAVARRRRPLVSPKFPRVPQEGGWCRGGSRKRCLIGSKIQKHKLGVFVCLFLFFQCFIIIYSLLFLFWGVVVVVGVVIIPKLLINDSRHIAILFGRFLELPNMWPNIDPRGPSLLQTCFK